MVLHCPFKNMELAALGGAQGAARSMGATDPALTDEVEMRLRTIAVLRRRLAEERKALLRLVGCADAHPPPEADRPRAPAEAVSTERLDERVPENGRFVAVTNGHVAEGARRLEAIGDIRANTQRAYESALRGADAWLRERRPGQALDDTTLAEYLAVLAAQGRCVSSAAQVVAAAKRRAKLEGLAPPAEKTTETLRRYRRAATAGPGQVRGISWEEADRMCDLAVRTGVACGLRDAALIAVASDALLRVSEVSNVQVEDVAFEEDGSARLLVSRSKTDQCGRGALLFLGPRTAALVQKWIEAGGVERGALFRRIARGGTVAAQGMGAGAVRRVIVDRARAAGIDGRVSGHSLRVGSAQSLANRGAGLVAMQKAGRWASPDMPARYTRSQAAADGAVARLRHQYHGRE